MFIKLNQINVLKSNLIELFNIQRRNLIYETIYKGPFDYKRSHTKAYRYPFGINKSTIEDEFNEIQQIRQFDVKEVSPFHLVWRYKSMAKIPWLVLDQLGL